ncbi:MAG: hypothetical protein JWM99_3 [Verrucomicrobiales bacterium]|nr:hypothetical protein [Verrucomicrobiales bacterium]
MELGKCARPVDRRSLPHHQRDHPPACDHLSGPPAHRGRNPVSSQPQRYYHAGRNGATDSRPGYTRSRHRWRGAWNHPRLPRRDCGTSCLDGIPAPQRRPGATRARTRRPLGTGTADARRIISKLIIRIRPIASSGLEMRYARPVVGVTVRSVQILALIPNSTSRKSRLPPANKNTG